jgi:HAD superfamily hydrolase (TIGR01509 family)
MGQNIMRLEGAIFDLDGTLLDSMWAWETVGSDLVRQLGAVPEPGLDEKVKTMSLPQAAEYCRRQYGLPQSAAELVELADARVDRFYREEVQPKPGAEKFLSLLKMEGVWMYVATATDRAQAEAALRRCGLLDFFRGILTCTEVGCGKDSPVIFQRCLTRLRCRKEECVVFEDSLHAIRTAKGAGFRVAAVYDPSSEADQPAIRALADYTIRSYDEFIQQDT